MKVLGGRYLYISRVRGNDELTRASLATGCCGQCTSERLRFLSRSALWSGMSGWELDGFWWDDKLQCLHMKYGVSREEVREGRRGQRSHGWADRVCISKRPFVNGTGKAEVVARDGPAFGRASAAPTQESTCLKWQLYKEIWWCWRMLAGVWEWLRDE